MEKFLVDSAATEALGRLLGRHLKDGDVLCLSGDLGGWQDPFEPWRSN